MDIEGDELNEWNDANDLKKRENRMDKSVEIIIFIKYKELRYSIPKNNFIIFQKTAYFVRPLFDKEEMENIKKRHIKAKKCKRILRHVLANCLFMSVMLLNSYLNKSSGTFFYQNHIQNVFESFKDVI